MTDQVMTPDAATRIVLATPDDAPLVHGTMLTAFAEYRDQLEPPSSALDETVETVRQAIIDGGAILAWIEDQPTGSAQFKIRPDHFYVGRVAVLPGFRQRGIASAMMAFLEEHARSLQQREVRVEVRLSLPSNVGLYRTLGYETVSEQPHPRGPEFRTVILGKRLTTSQQQAQQ